MMSTIVVCRGKSATPETMQFPILPHNPLPLYVISRNSFEWISQRCAMPHWYEPWGLPWVPKYIAFLTSLAHEVDILAPARHHIILHLYSCDRHLSTMAGSTVAVAFCGCEPRKYQER